MANIFPNLVSKGLNLSEEFCSLNKIPLKCVRKVIIAFPWPSLNQGYTLSLLSEF